jgi:hypothetical protein
VVESIILDYGRIVLNLISYFFTVCDEISSGIDITFFGVIIPFLKIGLHPEFTLDLSTISVGSFNIRASREVIPTEVRGSEIR